MSNPWVIEAVPAGVRVRIAAPFTFVIEQAIVDAHAQDGGTTVLDQLQRSTAPSLVTAVSTDDPLAVWEAETTASEIELVVGARRNTDTAGILAAVNTAGPGILDVTLSLDEAFGWTRALNIAYTAQRASEITGIGGTQIHTTEDEAVELAPVALVLAALLSELLEVLDD
jgi:hypothetical protein